MNDYFDQLESGLRSAVARRAHLPWHARLRLPLRGHGLAVAIVALVLTPAALAAAGVASGWFGLGKPDFSYPASSRSGLGKTIPGTGMLPLRIADPDGGPPWGLRLVRTDRGDTCIQVGRVEYGELGSLGIDDSWGNDHKFHAISPNEQDIDICGATDAAGHGFVSGSQTTTASAFFPTDLGGGAAAGYCQMSVPGYGIEQDLKHFPTGSREHRRLARQLRQLRKAFSQTKAHMCPPGSERMIFAGLLGPDAESITYKTPTGAVRSERTVGSDGAYLIVYRETQADCNDFSSTAISTSRGCNENYGSGGNTDLQGPNAVLSVTYKDGRTCSDVPSASFVAAYRKFTAGTRYLSPAQRRTRFDAFLAAHHLSARSWLRALLPQCAPVGWVPVRQPKITTADVRAPIKVTILAARRYCSSGPDASGKIIACNGAVPTGYHRLYVTPKGTNGPPEVYVTARFIAREPVTKSQSWYAWEIDNPGNNGGGSNSTQEDVRKGQPVTFHMFVQDKWKGIYRGTVTFTRNSGQLGFQNGAFAERTGRLVVGRFSFSLAHRRVVIQNR